LQNMWKRFDSVYRQRWEKRKGKTHTKDAAVCENLGYDRKSTE